MCENLNKNSKIKWHMKFLLCIIVIISIMVPSYASITSADGSMFVTKDEFDSAFTDFNSRFTTFEVGINSKIDSKITSYLDRNGIWNGTYISELDKKKLYITQNAEDRAKCYDATRNNIRDKIKIYEKFLFPTKKSGLLMVTYDMICDATNCNNQMVQLGYNGGTAGRDGTFYMFNDLLKVSDNTRKYFNIFSYSVSVYDSGVQDRVSRCMFGNFSDTITVFVAKGDEYYLRVGDYWDCTYNTSVEVGGGRIPYPWYIEIKRAMIY